MQNPSSFMPSTATDVKIGEVEQELSALVEERKILDERLQLLEKRIGSVLAQRPESGQNTTSTPEPVRVPLAQSIHEQVFNLAQMNAQLTSILNRIEL